MTGRAVRTMIAPAALLAALILLLPAGPAGRAAGECPWDEELAAGYREFFAAFSDAGTMAALQMMPVEAFVAAVQGENPPLVLDVRTPAESGVLGITLPGSLAVPMDRVFTPEVLGTLAGRKVVVVCQGGPRATAVALALRHVGLDDVWVLKGGTAALAACLNPKTAYPTNR